MTPHSEKISIEELICDATFQEFCLGSNLSSQVYWEEWIQKNSHRASDVKEARDVIYILAAKQGNRSEQLKQLRAGINQSESFKKLITTVAVPGSLPDHPKSSSRTLYRIIGAVAASVLIAITVYMNVPKNEIEAIAAIPPEQETNIQSGLDIRKTSILADGSLITLSKNSSLKFKKNFNASNREVWLIGEAYFDVKPDKKHPFIVHSLNNDIKVLGTVFNIKAYPGENSSETFLIHGRVEVIPHDTRYKSIILSPNQKLITSLITGKSALSNQELQNQVVTISERKQVIEEVKWVRNRLNIENEPLSDIAEKLEDWYGIEIVFQDEEVKNLRYSGLFESETVIKSLEALQLSYPFQFKVEQNRISISSK
ncbi:FecR family protein [Daejeonella lutea]|uniref:FecR family protein n=1 Tax=Daejeonella lutea TaxID=572036 RepID=A0A1T5CU31_9SPHI|nr:FecR domain-containing protein [Daejeonella lutea]SKB62843.1 FecR family protein [Daejeonella lutea]